MNPGEACLVLGSRPIEKRRHRALGSHAPMIGPGRTAGGARRVDVDRGLRRSRRGGHLACAWSGGSSRGARRSGGRGLGPADHVTLTRAMLTCGVAALTVNSFSRPSRVSALVAIAVVALLLDAVDGWVARHTRTASALGARFDMEVDAFLVLVLSVCVARTTGWWVLAIGVARYATLAASWSAPWLRGTVRPRYWRKVVAAVQGIVLTLAATQLLPARVDQGGACPLGLLAMSFGTEVAELWRGRLDESDRGEELVPDRRQHRGRSGSGSRPVSDRRAPPRRTGVLAGRAATTVLASLLVWFALTAPNDLAGLSLAPFVRPRPRPCLVAALLLVLRTRARRFRRARGLVLGALAIVKVLDMGFRSVPPELRPRDRLDLCGIRQGPAQRLDRPLAAVVVLACAGAVMVGVLVAMPRSVLRLSGLVDRHRLPLSVVAGFTLAWIGCAASGAELVSGTRSRPPAHATSASDHWHQPEPRCATARSSPAQWGSTGSATRRAQTC